MLPEHLGGHAGITNTDLGALTWLQNTYNIKSFLDIGCGPGGMVEMADKTFNLESRGIDGDYTLERYDQTKFIIHDFSQSPINVEKTYDLGWSCEFVEHVYESYIPNYMPAFQKCKMVVMTYAPPGWPGYHHVNCQDESYWIDTLKKYHFRFDEAATRQLRQVSTMNIDGKKKKRFVKNRGLVFFNEA